MTSSRQAVSSRLTPFFNKHVSPLVQTVQVKSREYYNYYLYPAQFVLTKIYQGARGAWRHRQDLAKTVSSTLKDTGNYLRSTARDDIWKSISQVKSMRESILMGIYAKETRDALSGTISSFLWSLSAALFLEGKVRPKLESHLDFFSFWIIYGYLLYLTGRELLPRIAAAPLYNAALPAALRRDLQLYLAHKIYRILNSDYFKKLNEIIFKAAQTKLNGSFEQRLFDIYYSVISRALAKIFIECFSDKELTKTIFDELTKDKKDLFFKKIAAKFKGMLLSEENLKRKLTREFSQYLAEDQNQINELDSEEIRLLIDDEVKLQTIFQDLHAELTTIFSEGSLEGFVEQLWDAANQEESIKHPLMLLLPSEHFHSCENESIQRKISEGFLGPVTYLTFYRTQSFLSWQFWLLGWLAEALYTGDLLLRQKFNVVGMTSEESDAHSKRNSIASVSLGCSMLMVNCLTSEALSFLPGGDSFLLPLAVYHLWFQLFSLNTMLRKDSLPRKIDVPKSTPPVGEVKAATVQPEEVKDASMPITGADLLTFNRHEAEQGIEAAKNVLGNTLPDFKQSGGIEALLKHLNQQHVQDIRLLLLGTRVDLKSMEDVLKYIAEIPAINLILKLLGRDILDSLDEVDEIKKWQTYKVFLRTLPLITTVISVFSKNLPILLRLLGNENAHELVVYLRQLIIFAERSRMGSQMLAAKPAETDFWGFVQQTSLKNADLKLSGTLSEQKKVPSTTTGLATMFQQVFGVNVQVIPELHSDPQAVQKKAESASIEKEVRAVLGSVKTLVVNEPSSDEEPGSDDELETVQDEDGEEDYAVVTVSRSSSTKSANPPLSPARALGVFRPATTAPASTVPANTSSTSNQSRLPTPGSRPSS